MNLIHDFPFPVGDQDASLFYYSLRFPFQRERLEIGADARDIILNGRSPFIATLVIFLRPVALGFSKDWYLFASSSLV